MITRKRGRQSNNVVGTMLSSGQSDVVSESEETSSVEQPSSVNSPSNSLELDDLFTTDEFNWVLDDDIFPPFGYAGLQDEGPKAVKASQTRASAQRSKLQDLSQGVINKNAIAARMNRLKKKEYVTGLEQKVGSLSSENRILKQENGHLSQRVEELENETRYLRAVLANESMLAQLLSRLSGVNGMKFSTSLFQGCDKNDHDYALPRKRVKTDESEAAGGVCLHVDKDHVSVEFCTKCAESASASLKM